MSIFVKKKYLFLILTILTFKCYSSVDFYFFQQKSKPLNSKDSNQINYLYSSNQDTLFIVDTSFTNFYRYNPLFEKIDFFATSANIGMPYKDLYFQSDQTSGFLLGLNSMNNYFYHHENIKFYDHVRPFTELRYVNGSIKEQSFRVIHSRKFAKNIYLGLNYNLINSKGFFPNQMINGNNFYLTFRYITSNNKYGILADYIHNKNKIYENGGIKSKSTLEDDFYLSTASNRFKESGFQILHYLNFFKKSNDTSVHQKNLNWRIVHAFNYVRYIKVYSDENPDTLFFKKIYLDSLSTYDSLQYYKIENNFRIYQPIKNHFFNFSFNIKHQYVRFADQFQKRIFSQLIPSVDLSTNFSRKLVFKFSTSGVLGDYNNGDYKVEGQLLKRFSTLSENTNQIVLNGSVSNQTPSWIYNHYYSNHLMWDNHFKKIQIIQTNVVYQYKNFKVGFNYQHLINYVYLDSVCSPRQMNKSTDIFSVYLYKNFRLGKHIGSDNKVIYQHIQNTEALRFPEWMTYNSLYYMTRLFKVLDFSIGADFTFNSSYNADAYMPAISSFYVQDKIKLKNFMYANLFLNAKLKRAAFFVSFQHFNSLFYNKAEREYNYLIPNYPLTNVSGQYYSIHFGVSWRFYD